MILLMILLFLGQMFLLRQVFAIKMLASPLYVVLFFYSLTAIGGYGIYTLFPDFFTVFGYTSAEISLTTAEKQQTLQYFLSLINTTLFGALVLIGATKIFREQQQQQQQFQKSLREKWLTHADAVHASPHVEPLSQPTPKPKKVRTNLITFACLIPTLILIVGISPEKIFLKDEYLGISNRFLVSIGNMLLLPACLGLGYNLANKLPLFGRFTCLMTLFMNAVILFSTATRTLGMFPILVTFGYWFNDRRNLRTGILLTLFSSLIFFPLIYLPLFFRGQPQHGLLPYLKYLKDLDVNEIAQIPLGFLSNFIYSFPLTGEVMKQRTLIDYPIRDLFVSLNPILGDLAGWYEIKEKFRLNAATPFNTIGEIYLYGNHTAFLMFFIFGLMMAFITLVFLKNLERKRSIYAIVLFMLTLLFAFTSLQYNLRSSTRFLYLAFVLAIVFSRFKRKKLASTRLQSSF